MDSILQMLLSWQFIVFGLTIAAIIFVLRQSVEYIILKLLKLKHTSKAYKIWSELLLPILPVLIGGLYAFLFKTYPYPNGLVSATGRVSFGLVAGLMSGLLYRVIKSLLFSKITTEPEKNEKP
jgi:hypothetical protein